MKRAAAGLAALAVSGAAMVAMAPSASAALVNATDFKASTTPYIVAQVADQPAGNLVVSLPALNDDDTVEITVQPPTGDCNSTTKNEIGFSAVPTSSNAKVVPTTITTTGCDLKNRLVLTADGAVAAGDVTISNIKYTSGAEVTLGEVRVLSTGVVTEADDPNAILGVDRIEGATRYNTAANLATESNACAEKVVLVSGENFPDALAASFLGDPILLTKTASLPTETKDALEKLGTKNVTIVGGNVAVSQAVETAVKALDEKACTSDPADGKINVTRIAGETRYGTARAVAMSQGNGAAGSFDDGINGGTCNAVKTAILVSGVNFPDALAAGALSSSGRQGTGCGDGNAIPMLLTSPSSLSADAVEALNFLGVKQVIIIGGTTAVNQAVETAVDNLSVVDNVERIAGENRTLTAAELAEVLLDDAIGDFSGGYFIATGANFPDALAAGPAAGRAVGGKVILLTPNATQLANPAGTAAAKVIDDDDSDVATLLGGTTALQSTVANQTRDAFNGR